ncbi:MAG: L,D-transpeptidase family protein [Bacteroidota bacterium]
MKLTAVLSTIFLGGSVMLTHIPQDNNLFSSSRPSNHHERKAGGSPEGTIYIIIDKSDYELQVYDDKGWYATYPVVFGSTSLDDKQMEGDRKTPEGNFKVNYCLWPGYSN